MMQLGLAVAILTLALSGCATERNAIKGGDDESRDTPEITVASSTVTTDSGPRTPVAEDFIVQIIETSRSCFGSAGCNVEGIPDLTKVTPDAVKLVGCILTYQVNEAESTTTESIELRENNQYQYMDLYISTASDVPLTATVTQVVCR